MTQHPFEPDDLYRFALVRDLRLSPDGQEIVYELKTARRDRDDYVSALWLMAADGGGRCQLTQGSGSEGAPRWSPDGRHIAFLSDRAGTTQIHLIARGGGEARCVTHFPKAVSNFVWSPDGKRLLARVTVETQQRPEQCPEEVWKSRPKVVTRQRYKSDSAGFLLHAVSRLFVVSLAGEGEPVEIGFADCDLTGGSWSPDGRRIAFCRARPGLRDAHMTDVWIVNADGRGARQVSHDVPTAAAPVWSPDGEAIVFTGCCEPGDSLSQLWLARPDAGEVRRLGPESLEVASFPLARAGELVWSADSRQVAFMRSHRGLSTVACIEVASGALRELAGGEMQAANLHGVRNRLAYYAMTLTGGGEISVVDWNGHDHRTVLRVNEEWWQARTLPSAERRTFTMPDGGSCMGWLLRPNENSTKTPLLVDAHGGPFSYAEFGFPYHVYWYLLCSRGWSVLALDPIGSGSYGRAFARALRSQWGELDLPQQLQAVSQLQDEGLVSERVAIAGKSYGGYMAAWAIGQTDRFWAAIASAPVTNLESHAGTSDSGYYVDPYDFEGELHERREIFRRLSPVQHAHKATTPTLILQGELDARCPVGQAEELFALLMRRGRAPVEMVLYPSGHHDLAEDGRASHRVDYHRRVAEWCRRWCEQAKSRGEPPTRRAKKAKPPVQREPARPAPHPAPAQPGV